MRTAFLLTLLSAAAHASPLPSIGLSYNQTDLAGLTDTSAALNGWQMRSIVADMRLPWRDFEFSVHGGRSVLTLESWKPTFKLIQATVDNHGSLIGTYGEAGASPRRDVLSGYTYGASARWYFGR